VVTLVLFALGATNPWQNVFLLQNFANPLLGAVLVFGLAFVAVWLLAPVQSEASQARRTRWRIGFGLGFVASLLGLGLFGPLFSAGYTEVAHSPSGRLTVVMVDAGTDKQRLRVWAGRGLGARQVGDLGRPCGPTQVSFRGEDVVHVATAYGERDLPLEPATGRPRGALPATCAG
jgi:hypothetical protein